MIDVRPNETAAAEESPAEFSVDGVIQGDCVEKLKKIPPGVINLTIADPPFNIDHNYGHYRDRLSDDEYLFWSECWLREVHRVSHKHGSFWLCIGDKYVSELDVLAKRLGWYKRSHVVWYFTFGNNCKKNFTPSHTHLLYYVKNPKKFTFNAKQVRVPSARQTVYNDSRGSPDGRLPDNTWILRPQEVPGGFETMENTWHHPRVCGTYKERVPGATNQMPEMLLARIIRASSHLGGVVLDPFAGTASTAVVSKKLGRVYLTYEISLQWAAKGTQRLRATTAGEPICGE